MLANWKLKMLEESLLSESNRTTDTDFTWRDATTLTEKQAELWSNDGVRELLLSQADFTWEEAAKLTEVQLALLNNSAVRELLSSDANFTWQDVITFALSYAGTHELLNPDDHFMWRGAITLTKEQATALNATQTPSSKVQTIMASISMQVRAPAVTLFAQNDVLKKTTT